MAIKSIKVKNLFSFDELIIDSFEDINCIVGMNNSGKSNLLKLIRFFYNKLENKRELPPTLYSNYSAFGTITIVYDISHIRKIVTAEKNKNNPKLGYFKEIFNLLVKPMKGNLFELTLKINSNESIEWSIANQKLREIISDVYPFFDIETRHINLYDWNKLWYLISRLKPFNPHKVEQDDVIEFFNNQLSDASSKDYKNYENYVKIIEKNLETAGYSYSEKVLSFVKSGLKGHNFLINNQNLETQSDGTNSHKFIESFISLLISLTRKAYITPILYIDEPEVGLHPKRNEELIERIYNIYNIFKDKYKTPNPRIIFATHSPNIVKQVIKLYDKNQQILHFSKKQDKPTVVKKMNSQYDEKKFLNIFSDNEARLFFSNFILFVEGPTEQEVFSNRALIEKFDILKNIDVYATNELVLKYINPSYAITSVPYLVLYDADKLIDIDIQHQKLNFLKTTINFVSYLKMYKRSYIGSKQSIIYSLVKGLLEWKKLIVLDFESKLYIKNINYSLLIKYINEQILEKDNYFLNRTTIEEVLINKESFCLFKRWLFQELKKSIERSYTEKTPECVKRRIKKKKVSEIRKFKKYIDDNFTTEKEKVTVFILVFGGKTETSITTSTKNYKELGQPYQNKIKKIKEEYFESLKISFLLGKTSGWTTSFLNFAINEIEKNSDEDTFKTEFEKYFWELYDIITNIEKKL